MSNLVRFLGGSELECVHQLLNYVKLCYQIMHMSIGYDKTHLRVRM